jgi:hypothetical protein
MSEDLEPISHKEFDTRLIRLPFQIFLLIAERDDEVHTNEWMTLIKMLKEKTVCESPYARGVLGKTEDKLQALKLGYERGEIKNDPEEIKKTLHLIRDRLKEEEAKIFEKDMEKMALAISEASAKKSFLGLLTNKNIPKFRLMHEMIEGITAGK